VADLPFQLPAPLAVRLRAAADVEGKLPRALLALGLPAAGEAGLLDDSEGWGAERLREHGAAVRSLPPADPLRLDVPDGSLDAIVSLWSGFRVVDPAALVEVDRALRDDEYTTWSRRDGPFLRGGFRIHVVHCFWTFPSVEDGRAFLAEAFGPGGQALADDLRRPRLSWNVAIYHRARGGVAEAGAP
jgi:hypothetical protein